MISFWKDSLYFSLLPCFSVSLCYVYLLYLSRAHDGIRWKNYWLLWWSYPRYEIGTKFLHSDNLDYQETCFSMRFCLHYSISTKDMMSYKPKHLESQVLPTITTSWQVETTILLEITLLPVFACPRVKITLMSLIIVDSFYRLDFVMHSLQQHFRIYPFITISL